MEWRGDGSSPDVEDRRDSSGGGGGFGGFGGGGFGGIHLGIGGLIIVGLLSLFSHQNLFDLFTGGSSPSATNGPADTARDQSEAPTVKYVSNALDDIQHNWDEMLPAQDNQAYRHAKLVLYRDYYPSGCGAAQTATGPFYCPEDEKVYLDLGFFEEMRTRLGASGDFAEAYVIAHEIGHHVQKILGIENKVRQMQERNRAAVNPLSVELELQADCLAGVWASTTEQRGLTTEDIKSALGAAAAVGDDRLQRAANRAVNPETFTHGSSAQRVHWLEAGLHSGKVAACDTFSQ